MPYPSQVNREIIVEKAREMIDSEGVDHISLSKLATALGIKAPSLYRYFDNKTELLQAVNTLTVQHLAGACLASIKNSDAQTPQERLLVMGDAYRAFAREHRATYILAYTNSSAEMRPDDAMLPGIALPLQAVFAELTGENDALAAMGGAWALLHGFLMLELNQQFRRLNDTSATFTQVLEAYIEGWTR